MTKIVLSRHAAPETARKTGLGECLKLVETAPTCADRMEAARRKGRAWGLVVNPKALEIRKEC